MTWRAMLKMSPLWTIRHPLKARKWMISVNAKFAID